LLYILLVKELTCLNSGACSIFELSTRDYIIPCLLQLHWLATSKLVHPVQTLLNHALYFPWDV